jgi:hypothetical protein
MEIRVIIISKLTDDEFKIILPGSSIRSGISDVEKSFKVIIRFYVIRRSL